MFKYSSKDAFLVLQAFVTLLIPVVFATIDLDLTILLLTLPVHVVLILIVQNVIQHHQTHWPMFTNKKFNLFYELILSIVAHIPTQVYKWAHMAHHKYVNDTPINGITKDPVSVFARGKNGQIQNVWLFCRDSAWRSLTSPYYKRSAHHLANQTQLRKEYFACAAFPVAILFLNFSYGLWLFFVVYTIAHFLNYAWHYGEHWGAESYRGDTTKDSVGIYNPLHNLLMYNSGYHQEHHHRPGVHWTKLPTVTSMLPEDRVIASGLYITNVPYWAHFKELFKPSSN